MTFCASEGATTAAVAMAASGIRVFRVFMIDLRDGGRRNGQWVPAEFSVCKCLFTRNVVKRVGWAKSPAAADDMAHGLARLCPRGQTERLDSVGKIAGEICSNWFVDAGRFCPPYRSTGPAGDP